MSAVVFKFCVITCSKENLMLVFASFFENTYLLILKILTETIFIELLDSHLLLCIVILKTVSMPPMEFTFPQIFRTYNLRSRSKN
jgi:hypothetical protein